MRRLLLIMVGLVLLAAVPGCAGNSTGVPDAASEAENMVTLWVTKDFGREVFFKESVPLQEAQEPVLDVLSRYVEVKTEYGGGFVGAIDGLESQYSSLGGKRSKLDWFYWANGIQSNVGGASYYVQPGDSIWWDYHDWQSSTFMPAVVGQYPEPFLSGYGEESVPTVILHPEGSKEQALLLAEYFRGIGVREVSTGLLQDELLGKRERITLALGTWEQFKGLPAVIDLIDSLDRTGIFARPGDAGIEALNIRRERVQVFGAGSAAIVATGTGQGDETPLWLVIATDQDGLARAVKLMVDSPGQLSMRAGVIVSGDGVVPVPVKE